MFSTSPLSLSTDGPSEWHQAKYSTIRNPDEREEDVVAPVGPVEVLPHSVNIGGVRMFRSFARIVLTTMPLLAAQAILAFSQSTSQASSSKDEEAKSLRACAQAVIGQVQLLKIPDTRGLRFQGKVSEAAALCRGGEQTLQFRGTPWVDWSNYWGTGDMASLPTGFIASKLPAQRGVAGQPRCMLRPRLPKRS